MNIAEFGIVCWEICHNFKNYEDDEVMDGIRRIADLVTEYDQSADTKTFKPKVTWEEEK